MVYLLSSELPLGCSWVTLSCHWCAPGVRLVYPWDTPGLVMGWQWGVPEVLLGCLLDTPGLFMGCPWGAPGLPWGTPPSAGVPLWCSCGAPWYIHGVVFGSNPVARWGGPRVFLGCSWGLPLGFSSTRTRFKIPFAQGIRDEGQKWVQKGACCARRCAARGRGLLFVIIT